jgi:hypothetical protein
MIPETVQTQVTIVSQHTERAWHATLANGRAVIAFRANDEPTVVLSPGDLTAVELRVTDFSQAHILDSSNPFRPIIQP